MIDVSGRLTSMALTLNPAEQRALANQLTDFSERLASAVKIDYQTGAADFEENEVRSAAANLQNGTSYAVGTSFADDLLGTLAGGFAVLDPVSKDAVPWRVLTDPIAVNRLPAGRLQALGISTAGPDVARAELNARFGKLPAFVDQTSLGNLSTLLQDRRIMSAVTDNQVRLATLLPAADPNDIPREIIANLRPQRDNEGGGEGEGGGGLGGGVGKILLDIAKAIPEFVTECLPNVETFGLVSVTEGPGIYFSETCARRLAAIVLAGGAPPLAVAGTAALAAGSLSAALIAGVAAVGGWPTFILAACIVIFSFWFQSCITSNGACIHFPWWAGFGPVPFAGRP